MMTSGRRQANSLTFAGNIDYYGVHSFPVATGF